MDSANSCIKFIDIPFNKSTQSDSVELIAPQSFYLDLKDILSSLTSKTSKNNGIKISEIPHNSLLHKKRSFETWDALAKEHKVHDEAHFGCYIQLTISDNAIVYDNEGREVAMLNNLGQFLSPFEFEHTGFVY